MKKINYKRIIAMILSVFFLSGISVFALEYIPLEKNAFPGITVPTGQSSLTTFLSQVFSFGIAIAVALAVIMVIWGGIEYMTTDAWEKKEDGQKRINSALLGLGLALISWILLYTINPCLVQFTSTAGQKCSNALLNTSTK
jgi:hypothetical protein